MAYGKNNHIVLQLNGQGQITGGGSEADVVGNHVVLGVDARIVDVRASAQAISSGGTALIYVQAGAAFASGTDVLSSGITLTNATPKGAAGVIADKGKIYSAGQEFALSENTTSTETIDGLGVQLTFRVHGA